ncbi:MAG: GAF domain-containing protein [Anaerolineaceae bacterium]|nr:GAF domain-containing protein [Anaerolineaceae bacterium]
MIPLGAITLLVNGLTLALSLGFLLIVLWHDVRKETNQIFAVFLVLVTLWNIGSFMAVAFSLIDAGFALLPLAIDLMELGFIGSSIAIYALTAALLGLHSRRFRLWVFAALIIVFFYQGLSAVSNFQPIGDVVADGILIYRFQLLSVMFYLIFDGMALYYLWRFRRKMRSRSLMLGMVLFIAGQSVGFLNPELQITGVAVNLASVASLIISFSVLRQEIITPLADRVTQVEAMHKVSLAVISQLAIDTILNQITIQAARWLEADGAGIFLNQGGILQLAAVYNLPQQYVDVHVPLGYGVAGSVAQTRQSVLLENYGRDWTDAVDLPLAHETFGSVISVPLVYANETIGVLMVIAGQHGRLFRPDDVPLLEMLGDQTATAISHSQLYNKQQKLIEQVEAARSQLETVLTSTENPVIAVDRKFRLIFANPAARKLVNRDIINSGESLFEIASPDVLPHSYRDMLRDIRNYQAHTYEIEMKGKFYLCHIAMLGQGAGWVSILNDITQLKELDRIQSEMIRMTSHDLKNPLQAALANLDLLMDDLGDGPQPMMLETAQVIEKQLLRMNRIISGILDLERIKATRTPEEVCNPKEIVQDALDEMYYLAQDRAIELVCEVEEGLPNFLGHEEQFKRALINLIENAIKFSFENATVHIRVRLTSAGLQFEVEDHGIGIPEALQAHVFERFFRGGQQGQKDAAHISGSGLGLSLVKAIVENHKGKVWLKSKENLGTKVFIIISDISYSH